MVLRRYELLFILHPELQEEQTKEVVEKFQHIIVRDGGKIIRTSLLGIRKLAFDIQRQSRGFYVLLDYAGKPEIIKELERNFRIEERVLNYQTIKLKDRITQEEIDALIAQKEAEPPQMKEEENKAAQEDIGGAGSQQDIISSAVAQEDRAGSEGPEAESQAQQPPEGT